MCVAPLDGWLSQKRTEKGKRSVVFKLQDGLVDCPVRVPCGECVECRQRQAAEWALRIEHESRCHDASWFVTLTYDRKHLPKFGKLEKKDLQLFLKRIRKDGPFRYFGVGEYGSVSRRPHYHLALFGRVFPDAQYLCSRSGHPVWRSGYLEEKWGKGLTEFGILRPESAAYVARYLTKGSLEHVVESEDVVDRGAAKHGGQVDPSTTGEFAVMSRRPGIGREWYEKYRQEIYRDDSVLRNGKPVKPPRYYDRLEELRNPNRMKEVKRKRLENVNEDEERGVRWEARQTCAKAKVNLFKREPL